MMPYLPRRLLEAALALWAAYTVTFIILYALPSDPVSLMLRLTDDGFQADPERFAALQKEFGFDQPILLQYLTGLLKALIGDFGLSVQTRQPVLVMILEAFPETAKLAGLAFVFSALLGLAIAIAATTTRFRWLASVLHGLPALGFSLPIFWIGLLLLHFFAFNTPLFPPFGNRGFNSLVLPAITLAVPTSAQIAQVLIRSLEHIRAEPYIATAIATGASPWRVQLVHALRNAILPAITILGLSTGSLLAGTVVTETVFSRAGIGRLTQEAVTLQDIPVVQGLVVFSAFLFIAINLLVDLLYPLLDPRMRHRGGT